MDAIEVATTKLPSLSQIAGKPALEGSVISNGPLGGLPFEVWDIKETIGQLAYLTHNHFRYYGKFPSTLAAGFLNRFAKPGDRVIDNYCGSGTTLVEAAIRGLPCAGIDINPFAVLAAKVKTYPYDILALRRDADELLANLKSWCPPAHNRKQRSLFSAPGPKLQNAPVPTDDSIDKWFPREVQNDLAILRAAILGVGDDWNRLFFLCAFFAIIRRVSVAYDGEVRPHVNPDKKPRDTISAFAKKVNEMMERSELMSEMVRVGCPEDITVFQGDNRRLDEFVPESSRFDVSLSHPPYLNCFDYLPVYRLEFMWADVVPEMNFAGSYKCLRKSEIRAWPATTPESREQYFADQKVIYSQLRRFLRLGAVVGVVIGDATLHKKLIRVHETFAEVLTQVGFKLDRIIYRTTHYGTGKYSYEHRADYHLGEDLSHWSRLDDDTGKRDAIIIARAC